MKLTVLLDNNTLIDQYFLGEPGLSIYIEDQQKRILFDIGYSDAFIRNAQKMGIDLLNLDAIILSHGHLDHTWGLEPLMRLHTEAEIEGLPHKKPELIAHPFAFYEKRTNASVHAGMNLSEEELMHHVSIKKSREPLFITENLVFLGEIARKFEVYSNPKKKRTMITPDGIEDDLLLDDTALAYRTDDGLVVITGCSHSGIANIVEHARRVCRDDRVLDIIGGLHLLKSSREELNTLTQYLKERSIRRLYACHCTDLSAKIALSRAVRVEEVGVGLQIEYGR
jgi:7,8-dihydropterin-6-yl-methyl-4-(beta-D-ribofuranosyl)aminobenzene 5'-phosphate synthase